MPQNQASDLIFTADELDLLGRTADALSAYMGKPVLAQVIDAEETGFEWVIFAVPLQTNDEVDDLVVVQIGGTDARIIGNKGGLIVPDGDIYDCQYLWAIQLSDIEGVRFIKIDQNGDEIAWSDQLNNVLPFAIIDEPLPDDDDDDDDDNEVDDNDSDDLNHDEQGPWSRTLH